MTKHELKIDGRWFDAVAVGAKSFEIRKDDRGFAVGDTLLISEWDSTLVQKEWDNTLETPVGKTGRKALATITYILRSEEFPIAIKEGYAVLGIKILGTHDFSLKD